MPRRTPAHRRKRPEPLHARRPRGRIDRCRSGSPPLSRISPGNLLPVSDGEARSLRRRRRRRRGNPSRRAQARRCGAYRAVAEVRPQSISANRHARDAPPKSVPRVAACAPRRWTLSKLARDRIDDHHQRQLPINDRYTDALGVELGSRWTAVESVGLYVPGGLASYPSSVLMNARAGQGRRRAARRHGGAVARRRDEPAGAGRRASGRRRGDLSHRRRAGRGRARLRHRDDRARRQDRRPRQRLRRRRQAAGVRHGRHRHASPARRRCWSSPTATTIPNGSPPTCWRRPSTIPPPSRS